MKLWKLETTVESEDEYDASMILSQIDRDTNRGDGIYLKVCDGIKPLEDRIRLLRKFKDE